MLLSLTLFNLKFSITGILVRMGAAGGRKILLSFCVVKWVLLETKLPGSSVR